MTKKFVFSVPTLVICTFTIILLAFANAKVPQNIITTDQSSLHEAIEEQADGLNDVMSNIQVQFDEGIAAFKQFTKLKSPTSWFS